MVPSDKTFDAPGVPTPLTAAQIGTATASDDRPEPNCPERCPASFPVETTIITWTATDPSNNVATETQNITV